MRAEAIAILSSVAAHAGIASAAPTVAPLPPQSMNIELDAGFRLELVLVQAGEFRQGSPASEAGRRDDETPREVALTRDYYIGKYEVTVEQFGAFVDATGYVTESERGRSGGFGFDGKKLTQSPRYSWRQPGYASSPQHPVSLVTHADALAFAGWLSERAGREIDLPTEAQWEYAHRAGTQTRFYAGERDAVAATIGWLKSNAPEGARAVGQLKPNALGIYDMAGNVYEWCRDWYGPYVPPGRATDPELASPPPGEAPRRVLRGGSYLRPAKDARAAARYRNDPGSRNADNGFRVVASTRLSPALRPPAFGDGSASPPAGIAAPPSPSGASASSAWSPLRIGIFAAAGLFGASIVYSLLRALSRRSGRRARAPSSSSRNEAVLVKPARDGFWVLAPEGLRGHTLQYRISGPAGVERSAVELEPNPQGQFVYTGYRPSGVSVEQVLIAGGAAAVAWNASQRREPADDDSSSLAAAPAAFRRYPSAY